MEDPKKSLFNNKESPIDDESPEESTWTMYFEEFFTKTSYDDECDHHTSFFENTLVSDAASMVVGAKKIANNYTTREKLSNSKKRRRVETGTDFEDTATSPSNSPKVHTIKNQLLDKKLVEKDMATLIQERDGGDFRELKKRGLCLVPFSFLTNFLA